ncbi:hypothetical protein KKH23_07905 [Patescibacteria group bacterium]|nr:hypothetical protein [Patescibacteria group bacterium]
MRNIWTEKETKYLIQQVGDKKIHPVDLIPGWKEMFGTVRTMDSMIAKLAREGVAYGNNLTNAQKEAKPADIKKQVIQDVKEHSLKRELNTLVQKYKELSHSQDVGDRVIELVKDIAPRLPEVKFAWEKPSAKKTNETAILLLGDTHIGETVDKEEVMGLGEYNFDVFARRMKFLAQSIKSITVKKLTGYTIDKLVIMMMGDMITGQIHEDIMTGGESMVVQVLQGAYVTAQFILEMQQLFPEVEVEGVLGNHGRLFQKKRYKRGYDNWDYIFYQFVSTFLAMNTQIKCNFPKGPFLLRKIYDWGFLVLHGDDIRSWMGIPFYGIQRTMWKLGDLLQGQGIQVHFRLIGHFHNTGELDRTPGEIIINGSMIGGTEYSLKRFMDFGRPTQLFMGCHKDIGLTWRYPLRLDLPGVDTITPYVYNTSENSSAGDYIKEMMEKKK